MEKIRLDRTNRKGYPAFWEAGGGYSNTGEASIIADRNGQAKRAVYVRRRGHLANDRHALILVDRGDYIVKACHHRKDFVIEIYQVMDFEHEEKEIVNSSNEVVKFEYKNAIVEKIFVFDKGEWNADLPEYLEAAVEAAKDKALCYHCRRPHFISNNDE